jgi:hypothetical protein
MKQEPAMKTSILLNVEAQIALMKAAICQIRSAACQLKMLEPDAIEEGLSKADAAELSDLLAVISRRTVKLAEAERAFHEKVNRVAPTAPDGGPVAMIGT